MVSRCRPLASESTCVGLTPPSGVLCLVLPVELQVPIDSSTGRRSACHGIRDRAPAGESLGNLRRGQTISHNALRSSTLSLRSTRNRTLLPALWPDSSTRARIEGVLQSRNALFLLGFSTAIRRGTPMSESLLDFSVEPPISHQVLVVSNSLGPWTHSALSRRTGLPRPCKKVYSMVVSALEKIRVVLQLLKMGLPSPVQKLWPSVKPSGG